MPEEFLAPRPRSQGRPALLLTVRLLLAVAFGIDCYLAWISVHGGAPIGCGPESGCGQVLHSRWAYWLGVPVSLLSLVVYGPMLAATFQLGGRGTQPNKGEPALFCGAVLLLGAAVWFTSLQLFVLKRLCPFCLVVHLCGVMAAGLVLIVLRVRETSEDGREIATALPYPTAKKLSLMAFGGVALLVIGQVMHQPRTFTVQSIPLPSNSAATSEPTTQLLVQSHAAAPVLERTPGPQSELEPSIPSTPPRVFPIYGGRFALDLDIVPVIGAPTNEHVIVSLFDYTCHHCRLMHPLLLEAQHTFSNQLVIASLPMPLDPQCNPTVKGTTPDHTNACEYARLSLTVWRADRTKHRAFDDWMFASEKPPPAAQAYDYARQLVGEGALTRASQDLWVEQQLKLDVLIYELAYRFGQGSMPQLIVGSNVAVGTFPQIELLQLLEKNLGLKKAPLSTGGR